MKILVLADRPPHSDLARRIVENEIDLVCTLGDLEYSQIVDLNNVNVPKIGIYGNHCSGTYLEELGIKNMHLQTFELGGLVFGGFEGSHKYKDDPYAKMYTQEEAEEMLRDFPHVDVMLCHSPPFGVNDEPDSRSHVGFRALRTYVEQKSPKYLLHGHTYPKEGELVTQLFDTKIIYVHGDEIIQIP